MWIAYAGASLPPWNQAWCGEGGYLTKRFPLPPPPAMRLRLIRTSRSASCWCQGLDSIWKNLDKSSLLSYGLEFSSLEIKHDRFRNRDEGTWQKPLEILTTKDGWSEHLKYVKDVLQSEETSRQKSINTPTHTYTHTHTHIACFSILASE